MRRWLALALPVWLAACGADAPAFVPQAEHGIELRWPRGGGGVETAQAEAGTRCTGGRHAVLTDEFTDGDETVARFDCR